MVKLNAGLHHEYRVLNSILIYVKTFLCIKLYLMHEELICTGNIYIEIAAECSFDEPTES